MRPVGDLEPAGAGGAFDDAGGRAGDQADAADGGEPAHLGAAGESGEGIQKDAANQSAEWLRRPRR